MPKYDELLDNPLGKDPSKAKEKLSEEDKKKRVALLSLLGGLVCYFLWFYGSFSYDHDSGEHLLWSYFERFGEEEVLDIVLLAVPFITGMVFITYVLNLWAIGTLTAILNKIKQAPYFILLIAVPMGIFAVGGIIFFSVSTIALLFFVLYFFNAVWMGDVAFALITNFSFVILYQVSLYSDRRFHKEFGAKKPA